MILGMKYFRHEIIGKYYDFNHRHILVDTVPSTIPSLSLTYY